MKKRRTVVYFFVKRLFDILVSAFLLIFVFLFSVIVFFANIFEKNKGPVIYKQKRIGKNGVPFYIFKFRSMVVDAEKELQENAELYNLYKKNNYKLPPDKDPRITKFGRFLRKSSLDELPQFFNILIGDMSLVGPRPIIEEELIKYGQNKNKFLSVLPGALGYWQASGRSSIPYPERCEYELYYVDHQSIKFDLQIILKSFVSIVKAKGAF